MLIIPIKTVIYIIRSYWIRNKKLYVHARTWWKYKQLNMKRFQTLTCKPKTSHFPRGKKCYLFRVLARYFVPFLLARDGYFFWRKAYSSRIESVTLFLLLISSWLLKLKNKICSAESTVDLYVPLMMMVMIMVVV